MRRPLREGERKKHPWEMPRGILPIDGTTGGGSGRQTGTGSRERRTNGREEKCNAEEEGPRNGQRYL